MPAGDHLRLTLAAALLLAAAAPAPAAPDLGALLARADAAAQRAWAARFEHGEGVVRDADAAVRLYCHAAAAGDSEAAYRLGWMYANARGVARDDALAAAWFARAAARGDEHARRMLGRLAAPAPRAECRLVDGSAYAPAPAPVAVPADPGQIAAWVRHMAPDYGLDPALVLAVIRVESGFDPRARSPRDARGLMQLMPATARRFGVRDPWDPVENLRGGMAYLRWLLQTFDGNERLALAGYNAGEGAVRRHRGIPPYPETRDYVRRVTRWRRNPASLPGGTG